MMVKDAKNNVEIHEILSKRWSPRAFSAKPVEKEKLQRIFEAARWSPSASNEQPWYFIVGQKGDKTFEKIFETLVEFNQLWVKTAPVVAISVGRTQLLKTGKPNPWYRYDVGQSLAHLTFQATYEGLWVHQMGGFDEKMVAELFSIPDGFEAVTAFALGYMGDYSILHPNQQKLELADRERKPVSDFLFSNTFGEKSDLV
jgi:nitroreductase